jgi:hypothetical protein
MFEHGAGLTHFAAGEKKYEGSYEKATEAIALNPRLTMNAEMFAVEGGTDYTFLLASRKQSHGHLSLSCGFQRRSRQRRSSRPMCRHVYPIQIALPDKIIIACRRKQRLQKARR